MRVLAILYLHQHLALSGVVIDHSLIGILICVLQLADNIKHVLYALLSFGHPFSNKPVPSILPFKIFLCCWSFFMNLKEFFLYSGHRSFVRCLHCKCLLPVCSLCFHSQCPSEFLCSWFYRSFYVVLGKLFSIRILFFKTRICQCFSFLRPLEQIATKVA